MTDAKGNKLWAAGDTVYYIADRTTYAVRKSVVKEISQRGELFIYEIKLKLEKAKSRDLDFKHIESVAKLAGRLGLPDLFFCHTSEEDLACEFWRKEQTDRPYDRALNPYLLISKSITWEHDCNVSSVCTAIDDSFRYVVDISTFDRVNEELEAGIQRVIKKFNRLNPEDVLPFAFNHVGQYPTTCKKLPIGR